MKIYKKKEKLTENDIQKLQDEVLELRQIVFSIQAGEIDALIYKNKLGQEAVFTLEGEDQPYRLLIESLSEGALTIYTDGKINHCNNKFATMVNDSVSNIIGTTFFEYIAEDQHNKLRTLFSITGDKENQVEFTLLVKNETAKIVLLSSNNIKLGNVNGISIVVTDITQLSNEYNKRIEIQNKLKQKEDLFNRITENINDVFWVMSPETDKVFYVSPGYEKVWGGTAENLYKHPLIWLESVVEEDKQKVMDFLSRLRTQVFASENYRIIGPKGTSKYIYVRGYQNKDANGKVIDLYGIAADVTDLTNITNQLHLNDKLTTIGTLAAGIAHEINNPISWIRGNLSYIKKHAATLDGIKLEELMNESIEGVDRIIEIASNLKGFSRINEADLSQVDLHAILDSALKIASSELKTHAKLEKKYAENLPKIKANSGKMQQVFLNLMMNAIQSMSQDTIENNLLRITTAHEGNRVRIDIADTGSGIKPEDMPKLFDPFFTTKKKGQGTGIGLSISHEIIKNHHGEITVKSLVGEGTTFSVYLLIDFTSTE